MPLLAPFRRGGLSLLTSLFAVFALCLTSAVSAAFDREILRTQQSSGVRPVTIDAPYLGAIERSEAPRSTAVRLRAEATPSATNAREEATLVVRSEARARSGLRAEIFTFHHPIRHVPRMGTDEPPRA